MADETVDTTIFKVGVEQLAEAALEAAQRLG